MQVTKARGPSSSILIGLVVLLAGQTAGSPAEKMRLWPMTKKAQQATIVAEIGALEMALQAYKEKFGDYPPDMTDPVAVKVHLVRAFPRYRGGLPEQYAKLDAATALVFWLGGVTDEEGRLVGLSANPMNPFDKSPSRIGPFFEFEHKRLQKAEVGLRYLPPNGNNQSDPYVYFRPTFDRDTKQVVYAGSWTNGKYTVRPYRDANPKSCQILSPGLDGKYWNPGEPQPGAKFPAGEDYTPAQYDDITNFSQGTLEHKMPKKR